MNLQKCSKKTSERFNKLLNNGVIKKDRLDAAQNDREGGVEYGTSLDVLISLKNGLWAEPVPEFAQAVASRLGKTVDEFRPFPAQRPFLNFNEILLLRFQHPSIPAPPILEVNPAYRAFLRAFFHKNQKGPTEIGEGWIATINVIDDSESGGVAEERPFPSPTISSANA